MAKSKVSKAFTKANKAFTKGAFDNARKEERTARGIPLAIGDTGIGVVTLVMDVEVKENEPDVPFFECPITIKSPEKHKGVVLADPLNLKKRIKETEKRSEEENFKAALEMLEQMGCPIELTQSYEDPQELADWFDSEERLVEFSIIDGGLYMGRRQKRVVAYPYIPAEDQPSADDGEAPEIPSDAKIVLYRNVDYYIDEELEDDKVRIVNCSTGRSREVHVDTIEEKN